MFALALGAAAGETTGVSVDEFVKVLHRRQLTGGVATAGEETGPAAAQAAGNHHAHFTSPTSISQYKVARYVSSLELQYKDAHMESMDLPIMCPYEAHHIFRSHTLSVYLPVSKPEEPEGCPM